MKRVTIVIEEEDGTTTTITTCSVIAITDLRALDRFVRPEPFRLSLSLIAHPGDDGRCLETKVGKTAPSTEPLP